MLADMHRGHEMDGHALAIAVSDISGIQFASGRPTVDKTDKLIRLGRRGGLPLGDGRGGEAEQDQSRRRREIAKNGLHGPLLCGGIRLGNYTRTAPLDIDVFRLLEWVHVCLYIACNADR